MKQLYPILLLLLLFTGNALGQAGGCDGARYYYDVFDEVMMTTVQYGQAVDYYGFEQDLLMDVYEPVGDTVSVRPTLIFAYGGAFVAGSREDAEEVCIEYARRGYVAAAFDYRLYPIVFGFPDSLGIIDVVIKSMHDMKAAIRYFRQDADTDNLFRVDTNRIVSGGASAGAIMALHANFADENDNLPVYFEDILIDNGGWEGNSGDAENLQYSSDVEGVISLSGGLHKKEWLNVDEGFLISFHGTNDDIVPYDHGVAKAPIQGVDVDFVSLDGSKRLHARADSLDIPNLLVSVPGGMHEDIYFDPAFEDFRDVYSAMGNFFMFEYLCPDMELDPPVSTSVVDLRLEAPDILAYPNPSTFQMMITLKDANRSFDLYVHDMQGRQLLAKTGLQGSALLHKSELSRGMFLVSCRFRDGQTPPAVKKVIFH